MQRLRLENVRAWQLAHAFTLEVCRMLKASAVAAADMRFSVGLFRTARSVEANVAEGFRRGADEASARCLREALIALDAATTAIDDGVDRGYFLRRATGPALEVGRCTGQTIRSLHAYLERCAQTRRTTGRARARPHEL